MPSKKAWMFTLVACQTLMFRTYVLRPSFVRARSAREAFRPTRMGHDGRRPSARPRPGLDQGWWGNESEGVSLRQCHPGFRLSGPLVCRPGHGGSRGARIRRPGRSLRKVIHFRRRGSPALEKASG